MRPANRILGLGVFEWSMASGAISNSEIVRGATGCGKLPEGVGSGSFGPDVKIQTVRIFRLGL
jgi:hypothetical protein